MNCTHFTARLLSRLEFLEHAILKSKIQPGPVCQGGHVTVAVTGLPYTWWAPARSYRTGVICQSPSETELCAMPGQSWDRLAPLGPLWGAWLSPERSGSGSPADSLSSDAAERSRLHWRYPGVVRGRHRDLA